MADLPTPGRTLDALRAERPLVHCVTNLVAMDLSANVLLAAGAAPVMALDPAEAGEVAGQADALCVNIGTSTGGAPAAARAAIDGMGARGRPWLLDPVGAGGLAARRRVAAELVALGPAAIRGNPGEIAALAGDLGGGRGVDSQIAPATAAEAAATLARASGAVVAVTGAADLVTDGIQRIAVAGGDPLMARVTGLGCALGSLVAAALAVEEDRLTATVHALALMAVVGTRAAARATGPGSLRVALLDQLHLLTPAELDAEARIA